MSDTTKEYLDLPGLTEYHSYVQAALDEKASAADFIVLTDRVDLMALEHQNFATKEDLKNVSVDIVVDDTLSSMSTNPVQNKVILAALQQEHANAAATYATKEEFNVLNQTVNEGIFINVPTNIDIDTFTCVVKYTLDNEYNLVGTSSQMGGYTLNDVSYESIVKQLYDDNLETICRVSAITNVISNEIGPKIKALETTIESSKWITMEEAETLASELFGEIANQYATKAELDSYSTISYVDTKWNDAVTIISANFATKEELAEYTTKTEFNELVSVLSTDLPAEYLSKSDARNTYATKESLTSAVDNINQTLQSDYATKSDLDNLTAGDVDAVSNTTFEEYQQTVVSTYALKEDLAATEDLVAMLQLEHQNFVSKTDLANYTFSATKVGVDFAGEDLNTYLDGVDDRIIALETANTNGIYVNDTVDIEIPAYYAIHQLELDQNYNLAGSSISVGKDTKLNTSYKTMTITLYQDVSKLKYQLNALNNVVGNEIGPKIKALEDAVTGGEIDLSGYLTTVDAAATYATKADLNTTTDLITQLQNEHKNFATKADLENIEVDITVDEALSSTSTNPVQNKVILAALQQEHTNTANTYATKTDLSGLDSRVTAIEEVDWATLRDLEGYLTTTDASNTYATKDSVTSLENNINQTLQESYATKTDLDNLTAGDVDAVGTEYFEEYQQTVTNTYATKDDLQGLSNTVSDLDEVVAGLQTSIGTTDADVAKLDEKVTDALNMIDDLNTDTADTMNRVSALEEVDVATLQDLDGYLSRTGGTMTGNVTLNSGVGIKCGTSGNGFFNANGYPGISSSDRSLYISAGQFGTNQGYWVRFPEGPGNLAITDEIPHQHDIYIMPGSGNAGGVYIYLTLNVKKTAAFSSVAEIITELNSRGNASQHNAVQATGRCGTSSSNFMGHVIGVFASNASTLNIVYVSSSGSVLTTALAASLFSSFRDLVN